MAGNLVITDEVSLPLNLITNLSKEGLNQEEAVIITQCVLLGGKLPFGNGSLDSVFVLCTKSENLTDDWFKEINRALKPGSKAFFRTNLGEQIKSQIERKLLISGFVDVEAVENAQSIQIKAKKASWTAGTSFPIKISTKTLPKIEITDESDLIDEESLLTEEDLKKPVLPVVGDCEVGSTRKACKNCTCGRAEEEQKVVKLGFTAEQINNPKSACGSCGLGDAFRCGGCPYKGLPPFKLGEKVTLANDFLAADI